jgi:ribonuclease HI
MNQYFLGKFPSSWTTYNICVMELYPILLALQLFAPQITNSNIILHSDNKAVVDVLTHKTTKHPQMLILLCILVLHCLKHNILFTAQHISGKLKIHTYDMLQAHSMDLHPTPIPARFLPESYKI